MVCNGLQPGGRWCDSSFVFDPRMPGTCKFFVQRVPVTTPSRPDGREITNFLPNWGQSDRRLIREAA